MLQKLSLCVLGLLFSQALLAQLVTTGKLPDFLLESSGLALGNETTIWTFNDSGGRQELYQCDINGKHLRTVKIKNAPNNDWEDITQDDLGNFYIGDFGNNGNKRKTLHIFKITNPNTTDSLALKASKISFRFEDQTAFPPLKKEMNFDCESLLWFENHLYVFTKHRTLPMKTNLYRIPDQPGEHVAKRIGSFATGVAQPDEHPWFGYWITAADISPDKQKIALISGTTLWIFYDFEKDQFFDGKMKKIPLGPNTQKEGVCFLNNEEVIISDEYIRRFDLGGKLYTLDLKPHFD
ncbi:MAG: hypothetical protein AAF554_12635 [Bacteroidota bacterium]